MTSFKIIFAAFTAFLLQVSTAAAENKVQYCDCHRNRAANVDVFVRNFEGRELTQIKADEFQNCTDVVLGADASGNLTGVELAHFTLPIEQLMSGPIYFGIHNKTMHTFALKEFDQKTGGILEIQYLTEFSVADVLMKDDFSIRDHGKRAKTSQEILSVFQDPNWASLQMQVARDENGEWAIFDLQGQKVKEIIGRLAYKKFVGLAYPAGLDQMVTTPVDQKESAFDQMKCLKAH